MSIYYQFIVENSGRKYDFQQEQDTCVHVYVCECACLHPCPCLCAYLHVCVHMAVCMHARVTCLYVSVFVGVCRGCVYSE